MPYSVRHTGIVLRYYPSRNYKVAILDKEMGRIDAVLFKRDISPGIVIQYGLRVQRINALVEDIDIINSPLLLARADLLFLHHVLEICFHFIPVGSCTDGIFDLLCYLYQLNNEQCSNVFKKVFLFKLFTIIGYYPDAQHMSRVVMHKLVSMPMEDVSFLVASSELERGLNDWLRQCIAQHPAIEYFNTMQFVTNN